MASTSSDGSPDRSPDREHGRAEVVPEGRIPVSEFAAEVQGGLSPFGEDVQLPLPTESLGYRHPSEEDRPRLAGDSA
jgi:succinate dehydrogenase / fumarate reductase iron-sulfur subunit